MTKLHTKCFPKQVPGVRFENVTKLWMKTLKKCFFTNHENGTEKWGNVLKTVPPYSQGLGGTVGHAFKHMHMYPAFSSWTDNWTVLWRIWTLKGNLSHLIIGIQRMPFICINTNKTHYLSAQRQLILERRWHYKTDIFFSFFLQNWTKDYRK